MCRTYNKTPFQKFHCVLGELGVRYEQGCVSYLNDDFSLVLQKRAPLPLVPYTRVPIEEATHVGRILKRCRIFHRSGATANVFG